MIDMDDVLRLSALQLATLIDDYHDAGYFIADCGDGNWQLLPRHELTGLRDYL